MKIIVDCNYMCYTGMFALQGLSYNNQQSGIIFNFINKIIKVANNLKINDFIFIWDSRRSKRRLMYTPYKHKRNKDKTDEQLELESIAFPQFERLKDEIIPDLGFRNNFMQEWYEGDDLIASIVKNKPDSYLVLSNDKDGYQLLDHCSMMNFKERVYTKNDLMTEFGCTPKEWEEVKQLGGCLSDNVEGVSGVKEKTAIKFMHGKMKPASKTFRNILMTAPLIKERNKTLTKLPFKGTLTPKIKDFEKLDIKDYISVCNRYGFRSLVTGDKLDKFRENFC
ncbi:MAG: hypothetical protein GQ540_03895 [Lutibacter sp.]|uniref:hypothetical protein n=1 Tax=Lutibacter sp. TaxID=1925666 RepID=UPI001A00181E|nr:hypothetical protein [Lutibacter sp.]NOR27656.1 hypothetical protein [Lutibacter sp.]